MEKRDKRFYSDAVHPQRREMKTERKSKTIAGSLGGAAVGILIGGPIGLVLCGAAGGYASNKISKQGERRMQREFEQANYQKYASQSPASNAVYV
jgi:outer membrane lipoprotein SlyB